MDIKAKKETNLSSACILPTSWSSIFWNVVCNSCPCAYQFDFIAILRKCDVIIPAIVSPDGTKMYGKWNAYEIPINKKEWFFHSFFIFIIFLEIFPKSFFDFHNKILG